MNKYIIIVFLFLSLSCDKPEQIPAYLHIPSVELLVDNANEGTSSQRITEAMVFVNNQNIGSYTPPASFPILAEGITDIEVLGVIWENGIRINRNEYPMLKSFQIQIDAQPEKIDTIFPKFRYLDNLNFLFIEDFESGNIFGTDLDNDPTTKLTPVSAVDSVFEGTRSGIIHLDKEHPICVVGTSISFPLSVLGYSYLEMDYKSDVSFSIAVTGFNANGSVETKPVITLFAKQDWNKIYINLFETITTMNSESYRIIFSVNLNGTDLEEADLILDNIKLIHS